MSSTPVILLPVKAETRTDAFFTSGVPSPLDDEYCDCFLPRRRCKIGNRLNHWPNLKIINRAKKCSCESSNALVQKYGKDADYANSCFLKKAKIMLVFQIMPKLCKHSLSIRAF